MIMLGTTEFRRIQATCWNADDRLTRYGQGWGCHPSGIAHAGVLLPTRTLRMRRPASLASSMIWRSRSVLPNRIGCCRSARFRCRIQTQRVRRSNAAVANGHRGVEIGNHVGDRDLDDAGIVTFLQHCARLGVPVFVHPWDMPESPRLNRWMARWLTGMPAETHLSILAMILGGVFDQVDESLRICFAHGGGSFAFWLGRMDNAWRARNDIIGTSAEPPSHYVRRFYVDSVVFDERALATSSSIPWVSTGWSSAVTIRIR